MSKLTSERVNGIKTGYWTIYAKDVLLQRLGAIEHKAPRLIEQMCDRCRYPDEIRADEIEKLDERCRACPATELMELVGGEEA